MGLTRQYLRFVPGSVFGLIGTVKSNIVFLDSGSEKAQRCAVGACENVIIWDLKMKEKYMELYGENSEVTVLASSPTTPHLAVGYQDGTVRVFDLITSENTVTFSGHKTAVGALRFDHQGLRLVSGGKDTDVIVWDVVSESGLYRLKGHKDHVTQVCFMKHKDILVTSSKDTMLKFWDLDTQHCFYTLVGHRSEIYDFCFVREESRLITGSGDSELRVWNVQYLDDMEEEDSSGGKKARLDVMPESHDSEGEEQYEMRLLKLTKMGSIFRSGRGRLVSMSMDRTGRCLCCHGTGNTVEVFRIATTEQMDRIIAKRTKKQKRKAIEHGDDIPGEVTAKLEDEILKINDIMFSAKVCAISVFVLPTNTAKIIGLLSQNCTELQTIDITNKASKPTLDGKIVLLGHRSDCRTLSVSSDNTAFLSASGEMVKIWNRLSVSCIRTMPCEYALSSLFAPGDRHVVIGTKTGKLQCFDLATSSMTEAIEAHTGAVWTMCLSPDKGGIVSGGADKLVKFWSFELDSVVGDESKKHLSLKHSRTLQMDEDVLSVKYSPDGRLLAVALLDNTVKVFFTDTLKFFLSLFGHKMPVLCMDISSDSTLIITGSADKNVKIWGLDFGDCHRSIFAHDDSIMCAQFLPKTHLFFTGGKDGKLKQWDADNFEHILTLEMLIHYEVYEMEISVKHTLKPAEETTYLLEPNDGGSLRQGHHAEIWCLAVSPSANFVLTASHDRSLRMWEKTREPLVLEHEREIERDKEHEAGILDHAEHVVAGETSSEVGLAGKKTMESVKATERIMEAIELYKEEHAKVMECEYEAKVSGKKSAYALHPLFAAFNAITPEQYVLEVIKKVKSSELEESLLSLPFAYVLDLLSLLNKFLEAGWETELTGRCLIFLLKLHHGQITTSKTLLPVLTKLQANTSSSVATIRDTIGFNLAGLNFLKRLKEESEEVTFFADASIKLKDKKRKEKAILVMKT